MARHSELMMINPKTRRRKTKRRTTAKRKTSVRRRRNPVSAYVRNPVRRRRNNRRTVARRPRNYRRGLSAYVRNPNGRILEGVVIPAAQAASGALALDVLWGFLPIPPNLKMGPMRYLAKGAGAIGMLWLGGMVLNKSTAKIMATGALTTIMHDAFREAAQNFMPNVPLDGIGYYSAGWPAGGGVGAYTGPVGSDRISTGGGLNGMGAYMSGDLPNYLADRMLAKPFAGPSKADMSYEAGKVSCLETEDNNMGGYNNYYDY